MRTLVALIVGALVIGCAWLAVAAGDAQPRLSACAPAHDSWRRFDQGWTAQAEQEFWFTSQGSQMMPYAWFMALEQAEGGGAFHERSYLESFGFIGTMASACNPDGLPVGFARDAHTNSIGLTCAACHTRYLEHDGRKMLVNGAPSEIDLPRFIERLATALEYAATNDQAWARFARRVGAGAETREALRQRAFDMRRFQRFVSAGETDNAELAGPGRVDAFGAIFNRVTSEALGIDENFLPADAPVNYPFVWGAPQGRTTQWIGTAPNHVPFGPLARNLGVGLGLFGSLGFDARTKEFRSDLDVSGLHRLESLVETLRAPRWSDGPLPAIDRALAERGARQFEQHCTGCHSLRSDEASTYAPHLVALADIGTDAVAAENYYGRTALTGALNGRAKSRLTDERFGPVAHSHEIVVAAIIDVIAQNGVRSVTFDDVAALASERPADPAPSYKARPLNGIWATAPYLHNGSVPSLRDLLDRDVERPRRFALARHTFDPVRVGLAARAGGTWFDTSLRGNSNRGHNFGTELADEDKDALVEFLKRL